MKRLFLLTLILVTTLSVNAQTFFTCTGDNVNVRKGPGKNYRVMLSECEEKCQLYKGKTVKYLGKTQNGFSYVRFSMGCSFGGCGTIIPMKGWVSSQYLKKVARLCPECNGVGYFNQPCHEFEGPSDGHPMCCPCQSHTCGCLHDGCYGKQHCVRCDGLGCL